MNIRSEKVYCKSCFIAKAGVCVYARFCNKTAFAIMLLQKLFYFKGCCYKAHVRIIDIFIFNYTVVTGLAKSGL